MTETSTKPSEKNEPLVLCDRCGRILTIEGVRAVHKDGRELTLCTRHHKEHDAMLTKQGWRIELLVPPEPEAGPKERVRCGRCGGSANARDILATPDSRKVQIVHCLACDVRTCNAVIGKDRDNEPIKCDSLAMTREERLCPKGHPLFGADE